MPENTDAGSHGIEVSTKPQTFPEISKYSEFRDVLVEKSRTMLSRVLQRPREGIVDALKGEIAGLRKAIHTQFPKYPDNRVDMLLDSVFGFARLKKETLLNNGKTEDINEKSQSALIQHALTHQIITASETDDENYVETTYALTRNLALLAANMTKKDIDVKWVWGGVRNQVAIVKVLQENNFRIFLPDYAQDSAEIPDSKNEVMQLDVKNGIDLIAVAPDGRILLIDAKGRAVREEVAEQVRSGKPEKVDMSPEMPPLVSETILNVAQQCKADMSNIYRMKVVIPTEGRSFIGTDFLTDNHTNPDMQRQSLQNFGKLQPEIADGIMDQMDFVSESRKLMTVG